MFSVLFLTTNELYLSPLLTFCEKKVNIRVANSYLTLHIFSKQEKKFLLSGQPRL